MAVSVEMVKRLRDATGAGVLDSKKALESSGGDFDRAIRLLRERGLAKAARRSGRATTEGRVEGRYQDGRAGLLVEVNCETDFVGRSEGFVSFAHGIADHLWRFAGEEQPLEAVMNLPFTEDPSTTPARWLQDQIAVTGENMAVRRFARYELGGRPGVIEVYIHPGNRVGVMLELDSTTPDGGATELFTDLAHDLALHIAASAPLWATRRDTPVERVEAERAAYRKQALDAGKPEAIVERIIEGRLRKFYGSVVLSEQPFVKDDKLQIAELIARQAAALGEEITVRRFVRYELGEALE